MKKIIAMAIALFVATSAYSQVEWSNISTQNDGTRWDVKAGSLEFSTTKGGTSIATVVGRMTNPNTSDVSLSRWYVSANDCSRRMGKMVSLDVNGAFKFESDFVIGGGNVASAIAEVVCGAAAITLKARNDKSL